MTGLVFVPKVKISLARLDLKIWRGWAKIKRFYVKRVYFRLGRGNVIKFETL